jgi:DNA polymerase-3 subunit delta
MGLFLNRQPLYDSKIPAWIESYISDKGYKITSRHRPCWPNTWATILSKIANELEKLMLNVPQGRRSL